MSQIRSKEAVELVIIGDYENIDEELKEDSCPSSNALLIQRSIIAVVHCYRAQ